MIRYTATETKYRVQSTQSTHATQPTLYDQPGEEVSSKDLEYEARPRIMTTAASVCMV